jgi:hypothetical protein
MMARMEERTPLAALAAAILACALFAAPETRCARSRRRRRWLRRPSRWTAAPATTG